MRSRPSLLYQATRLLDRPRFYSTKSGTKRVPLNQGFSDKLLESAIAQPRTSFGGTDLYSSTVEKAAAICFSLIKNHPFIDGNKRVGHAAMATFLLLNGLELSASVDSQEIVILGIASGTQTREDLVEWIQGHIVSSGSRS